VRISHALSSRPERSCRRSPRDLLRLTLEARGVEIAVPGDLPSQTTKTALPPGLYQEAERFLDNCPFRSGTAAVHCLAHQAVVDINVGSHL
jgi:hypothetical protein